MSVVPRNVKSVSLRAPKMADRLVSELRKQIVHGDLPEGTMLPTEVELMEQFGVSRPILREAYRVLESESLIVVLRGVHGGARVTRPQREVLARYAGVMLEYENVTIKDVYEAREALEPPLVGRLARTRTKSDMARLDAAIAAEIDTESLEESINRHGEFHGLLVELVGNKTLLLVTEMLHHVIHVANRSLQPVVGADAEKARRRSARTHQKTVELIRDKDDVAAEALWRKHVSQAEEYVLAGSEMSTVLDLLG